MSFLPIFVTVLLEQLYENHVVFLCFNPKSGTEIRHLQQLHCVHFLPGRHNSRDTPRSSTQRVQQMDHKETALLFSQIASGVNPSPLIKPEQRHVFWLCPCSQLLATDNQSARCSSPCGVPNTAFQVQELSM